MKFSLTSLAVVALASQSVVASSWFAKAAYNKWHETELERWLSDHDVPYPTPADRKDLQDLVKKNWENSVIKPYNSWDVNQLQNYLTSKGYQAKKGAEKNKDSLISQVQTYWTETADQANDAYSNVQNWVFDSWTESQLKSFLDYHNIPNPSPRTRDSLLYTARSNYQAAANKLGETVAYPGDWLYQSWSNSDLKAWLDERGIPVPQTGSRDKLIASIRRNAYIASTRASEQYSSASSAAASASSQASASASGAVEYLSDALLNSWSDSQIKEWADKNGIKVPQGSKRNELLALARKHSAQLTGDNVSASAASAYGAATSSAGNFFAQQTANVVSQVNYWKDYALNQFGLASAEASKSFASASALASASLSSASSVASASASSASSAASKGASSVGSAAADSLSSGGKAASKSAASASARAKQEL